MTWTLTTMPDWYQAQARFNLIFFKIANHSPTPAQDLQELGLDGRDLRYIGTHSFMPASPMNDPAWVKDFCKRSTYAAVLRFYANHPVRAARLMLADIADEAWQRRPVNLSNFQREAQQPPGAKSYRFATWSSLRSRLFQWWPNHILLWNALILPLSFFLGVRAKPNRDRALAWAIFAISLLAAMEFGMSSLADACETYRHLLMFHLFTDTAIFLALVYAAAAASGPLNKYRDGSYQ
jgi:hypothetical protein